LASSRVTYGEAACSPAIPREDEETVAGGHYIEDPVKSVKLGDGMELGIVVSPVVKGEEVSVVGVLEAGRDGETGLPAMVCQEEFADGGGVPPGAAHGAAT
jgi:hypothetical protein